MLLARFHLPEVVIENATTPSQSERRSRYSFTSDGDRRRMLVAKAYGRGQHFLGEWHTHPQSDPTPSACDLQSMAELFVRSVHELNFFVMIIVGNSTPDLSLWVSLHDASSSHQLELVRVPASTFL